MEWWNGFFSHSFCLLVCVLTVRVLVNQETKKPETKRNDILRLKGHGEAVHVHLA